MLRIILDIYRDPLVNMAVDEAIFRYRGNVDYDTIRIYMWRPSGVSIGKSQDIHETLYLDCIERYGYIPVIRPTGGGALLHMEGGEVTYSVVLGRENPIYNFDIQRSSIEIAKGVYNALYRLGVEAGLSGEYRSSGEPLCYFRRGSSDILIGGRKISGSAQLRDGDALLQHGTLLLKVDPYIWSCVIRDVDPSRFRDKVVSLSDLDIDLPLSKVYMELVNGFIEVFGDEYFYGSLSSEEVELVSKLLETKYIPFIEKIGFSR
ncbi:MAG TPA: lipoate--protein ligase family protein [Thermoprotei archaeon]|nr:lipoate--protein ligase family protein [Thermoprotei archaeon]